MLMSLTGMKTPAVMIKGQAHWSERGYGLMVHWFRTYGFAMGFQSQV